MRIGKRTAIGVVAAILTVSAIAAAAASQKYPVMPWQTAAMQGKAHAEYIMGNAYAAGMPDLGIPKDLHQAFEWYLDVRRYGSFPHAGFGLGLERTVAWVCGLKHVRETIPFPRMLERIYP